MLGTDHPAESLTDSTPVEGPADTLGLLPKPALGEEAWPDNPLGPASALAQLTEVPDEAACWPSGN